MKKFLQNSSAWLIPLLIVMLLAPFLSTWDLAISRWFYQNGQFMKHPFLEFTFKYGVVPAQILSVLSAIFLGASYFFPEYAKWRKPAWTLLLTMVLGIGLLINVTLKDHWGRPRPRQVVEFGGKQTFHPFYKPQLIAQEEKGKSFPSGHAAMGFYFLAPAYIFYRLGKRGWMWVCIGLTIVLGAALTFTRIAQGGHFLSDTIFSALIVWLCCWICYRGVPHHANID